VARLVAGGLPRRHVGALRIAVAVGGRASPRRVHLLLAAGTERAEGGGRVDAELLGHRRRAFRRKAGVSALGAPRRLQRRVLVAPPPALDHRRLALGEQRRLRALERRPHDRERVGRVDWRAD
jgi:hypothetical protein